MNLFEEFKLYEAMWEPLTEAKADTQRLIAFAGEDLANRFLAIKNKLKAPENDLYYWIKNKTAEDLADTVNKIENAKSERQQADEQAEAGARLVADTPHWKVYHITSYEAARKYGKDTKWCITGNLGMGDHYWNEYKEKGADFYFLITKGNYDPRGKESKFALVLYEARTEVDVWDDEEYTVPAGYEIYNQQDYTVLLEDVPFINEVKIPGINLDSYEAKTGRQYPCEQEGCNIWMPEEQYNSPTIYGKHLCAHCYNKYTHTDAGLAEEIFALALKADTNLFKQIMQKRFEELSEEELIKIIKVWQHGRKNNLFVDRNSSGHMSLDKAELGFLENLKVFKNITLDLDTLRGKKELPNKLST